MTTYGQTGEACDGPGGWPEGVFAEVGPGQHLLSAGYRLSVAAISGPLPASIWLRRFAKAPGVRGDARSWYGVEPWLATLGDAPVPPAEILAALDASEFTLEVGWSRERDAVLVRLPVNPFSARSFLSTHHDDVDNILLSIRLSQTGDGQLRIDELQSDWHQAAAQGGFASDPFAVREAAEAVAQEAENRARACAVAVESDGEAYAALLLMASSWLGGGLPHGVRQRASVWQYLRSLPGQPELPGSLSDRSARLIRTAAEAFISSAARHRATLTDHVPPAPFRADWPRLGLALAMALGASTKDADGGPAYDGMLISSGDGAAAASGADEPVSSVSWNYDDKTGSADVEVRTSDENGSGVTRPRFSFKAEGYTGEGPLSGILGTVAARIADGDFTGRIDEDEIYGMFPEAVPDIVWRNAALRRFYDSHLPREIREVSRAVGAGVSGAGVCFTDASRQALAARFPGLAEALSGPAAPRGPGF